MKTKKECTHRFTPTPQKGEWMVKVISTNNRGKPDDEKVRTTVFKCENCGVKKEYPDMWERTFVAPKHAGKILETSGRAAPARKKLKEAAKVKMKKRKRTA